MGSSHVVVNLTAFVTYRHDTDIFLSPATPCVTVTLVDESFILPSSRYPEQLGSCLEIPDHDPSILGRCVDSLGVGRDGDTGQGQFMTFVSEILDMI